MLAIKFLSQLEQPEQRANALYLAWPDSGFLREGRPFFKRLPDLLEDGLRFADPETIGQSQAVIARDLSEFPVYRHQVLVGPLPFRVMSERDVVSRGELPRAAFAKEK